MTRAPRRGSLGLSFVLWLLAPTGAARAEDVATEQGDERGVVDAAGGAPPHFTLDAGVGTALPVFVGSQLTLEGPWRVLGRLEIGWMPTTYVDLVNNTVVALGGYDEVTAQVIAAAIDDSTVLRVSGGWRPWTTRGFEVLGGYTLVVLGGGVSAIEVIEAVTGQSIDRSLGIDVPLSSTLHALHGSVGWTLWLHPNVVLRASLGYLQVIGSNTVIKYTSEVPRRRELARLVERQLDAYLDATYKRYVRAPWLGFSAAYRFP